MAEKVRKDPEIPLGIEGECVAVGDHVAYFWETEEEFARAVRFLEIGFVHGNHCVVFGHHEANEKVLGILRKRGFDTESLREEGRLSVIGGDPDEDEMLGNIGRRFEEALEAGASMIRLLGNIGWGRSGWPDDRGCLVFEAKVTGAAKSFPSVVMCMYDVAGLSGDVVLHGAFETHPKTFHGNLVRENPCHTPIDEFLERMAMVEAEKG